MQPDAFAPTAGRPASPPVPPPAAGLLRRDTVAILLLGALVIGLGVGVVIARATGPVEAPASVTKRGELKVTATPSDANVVIDGRFVGVTPIDRLDLEPGKHSVVLDAFGFQPYAGTLGIEERGVLNLAVLMAPIGSELPTRGTVGGVGTAVHSVVPPSALLPASRPSAAAPAAPPPAAPAPGASVRHPTPATAVVERPHRDCDGEHGRCKDSCSSAEFSCTSSCQGCASCTGNWDDCHRQCAACRAGCDQNVKFCQSSCDNQANNCTR